MNKADIAEIVLEMGGGTKAGAERMVNAIFDSIIDTVKKGDQVSIAGFGVFEARKREARMGRNPKTGEAIKIAASMSPKFRASKGFKDAVNQ